MSKRTNANAGGSDGEGLKKLAVSGLLVGGFVVYTLAHGRANATALGGASPPSSGTTPNTPAATVAPGDTPSTTANNGSQYKDGTYTGGLADAQWGYVQVKVVIAQGRMSDVQFVQYPNDRNRSIMINQYADPILDQEAIQAQSATVDIVTGATDSSFAFMQSLDDALTQAQG